VPVEGRTSVGRSAICRSISGLLPVTVPVLWRNGVLAAAQRLRGMGPGTCPTGIALRSGSRRVGEEPKNPLRRTGREGDSPKPIDGLQLLERTRTSTRPSRCAHRSVESLQYGPLHCERACLDPVGRHTGLDERVTNGVDTALAQPRIILVGAA
jgi:hypothetical protein